MTLGFDKFVATAKTLAEANGLVWHITVDRCGHAVRAERWNLTQLAGTMPPPTVWLSNLSTWSPGLDHLYRIRASRGASEIRHEPLTEHWSNLKKAVIIDQILVRRNSASHALAVAEAVGLLAAAADGAEPWNVGAGAVQDAYCAALLRGTSGKHANNFKMAMRIVWDQNKLHDGPPLIKFCEPTATPELKKAQDAATALSRREANHSGKRQILADPFDRGSPEKLPEPATLEALARVVLTCTPNSFSDAVRLAAWRVKLFTPFRLGEDLRLPLDCIRHREYFDSDGTLAGERGGISRSVELRHFMEKSSKSRTVNGKALVEERLHVPLGDEEFILETIETVKRLTEPLRRTLKQQAQSGRHLPQFDQNSLRPAWELFLHVSGGLRFTQADLPTDLVDRYYRTFDFSLLEEMVQSQLSQPARPQR